MCKDSGPASYECTCASGWSGKNCTDCTLYPACSKCDKVPAKCVECALNYVFNSEGECICKDGFTEDKTTMQCMQSELRGGSGSNIGILIACIIGGLILLILVTLIIISIAVVATKKKTKELEAIPFRGEARDNPLYMKPDDVTDHIDKEQSTDNNVNGTTL
jgi:hypothetical protein